MMMPSIAPEVALIGAIAAVPIVLVGIFLVRKGLRPKRRGDEPRCAACDYDLTGIASQRCPECGAELDKSKSIVRGIRHRGVVMTLAGVLLVAVGIAVPVPYTINVVRQTNWYQYKPTSLVTRDLDSPSVTIAAQAWTEMLRREKAGKLSPSARSSFLVRALKVQGAPRVQPILSMAISFLATEYVAGRLTGREEKTFLEQSAMLYLNVTLGEFRTGFRSTDPLHLGWGCETRAPAPIHVKIATREPKLDGHAPAAIPHGFISPRGPLVRTPLEDLFVRCPENGQHVAEVEIEIGIYDDRLGPEPRLVHEEMRKVSRQFTLRDSADGLGKIIDPGPISFEVVNEASQVSSIKVTSPP